MSITITATVGSETANSFVTLAEFRTYLGQRLNSGCILEGRSATDLSIALIEAGREFNEKAWRGVKADDDQAMAFPRRYVPMWEGLEYYDADVIPQPVKDAQCERAIELLEGDTVADANDGVLAFTGSGISVQYQRPSRTTKTQSNRLISRFLLSDGGVMRA